MFKLPLFFVINRFHPFPQQMLKRLWKTLWKCGSKASKRALY